MSQTNEKVAKALKRLAELFSIGDVIDAEVCPVVFIEKVVQEIQRLRLAANEDLLECHDALRDMNLAQSIKIHELEQQNDDLKRQVERLRKRKSKEVEP